MERIFHFRQKPENPVEKLIKKEKEETEKAINKAKIMKCLNLSPKHLEIFNASFNYYVLAKWAQEASFLSKDPEVEIGVKMWGPKSESREIMRENEINDQAVRKLREEMQEQINSAPEGLKPSPRSMVNSANYVSTLYIDCLLSSDKNFKKEFKKKAEYINKKIIIRNP